MKTDEWEFRGIESRKDALARGFVFLNKKHNDYVIVKAARYILKGLGVVLFLTFSAGVPKVTFSNQTEPEVIHSSPLLEKLDSASNEERLVILESLAKEDMCAGTTGTDVSGF